MEHLAYRFKEGELIPIKHPHIPNFSDLLHIERQKETLRRNSSSSYRKIFHRTRFRRQGDYKLPCEPQENIPRTYYVRIPLIPTP